MKEYVVIRHDEDGPARMVKGGRSHSYKFNAKGDPVSMGTTGYGYHWAWHEDGTRFTYHQAVRELRKVRKSWKRRKSTELVGFRIVQVVRNRYGAFPATGRKEY